MFIKIHGWRALSPRRIASYRIPCGCLEHVCNGMSLQKVDPLRTLTIWANSRKWPAMNSEPLQAAKLDKDHLDKYLLIMWGKQWTPFLMVDSTCRNGDWEDVFRHCFYHRNLDFYGKSDQRDLPRSSGVMAACALTRSRWIWPRWPGFVADLTWATSHEKWGFQWLHSQNCWYSDRSWGYHGDRIVLCYD